MDLAHRLRSLPLVLLFAAACLLACSDTASQMAEHEALGQEYLDGEKWPEAQIEYRNMLQIDPNSAVAHWGLAQALLAAGDSRAAYWELQETVRLDPGNLDAKLRYAQFLVFGKEESAESALKHADEIIESEPSKWQAYVLRAQALSRLKRDDEVGATLLDATRAAPDEGGPHLVYANFLRRDQRNEEAEASYRKVVELDPGFPSYGALAGFLAALDRDDEAEGFFSQALEAATPEEKVSAYTLYANFLIARDRGDEAAKVLLAGIESQAGSSELIYALASFYHSAGRREEADAMMLEATEVDPSDPKPFLSLSNYRSQIGDMEGALEAAELAIKADPDFTVGKLRKAELLIDRGYLQGDKTKIAQGRAITDAVLSQDASMPEALFVSAKIDLAEGKVDDAIADARRALDSRDEWAKAHFLLGSALFLSGDRGQARASAARALELDPNMVDAQKLLARIHAALGDHELAIEAARKVLEGREDPTLRILVAQSLVRQRETAAALAELERIPVEERDEEAEYALGRVHVLLGNAEAARAHLLRAYEADPNRYETLRSLLDSDLRAGTVEESAKRIRAAVEADPENASLHQLAGEIALYEGRNAAAESSFRKAIDLNPNDLRAYGGLARFLALTGKSAEVLETYESALEANPSSGPMNLVVGSLYEAQQRPDEAMERYEEAIRLAPELAVAKNNLAYLLAERGDNLDRALDLAQEAKAQLPDNPNTADTLGWVLLKKDVPSAAIDYLKEAVGGMQPDNAQRSLVRHHLALAYEANDQAMEARKTWLQALGEIADYSAPRSDGQPARPEPPWALEVKAGLERVGS